MSRRERRIQEEKEEKRRKQLQKHKNTNQKKKTTVAKKDRYDNDEIEVTTTKQAAKNNVPRNKRKKKKKKITLGKRIIKTIIKVILIMLLLFVILVGCFIGYLGFKYDWNFKNMTKGGAKEILLLVTGQTEKDLENLDPLYCLVLGVSTDQDGVMLTDTIIVCAYYPKTQQASMLSIPRDTFIGTYEASAGGYDKINSAYQAGYQNCNIKATKEEKAAAGAKRALSKVEEITGLEIGNYLVVNNEGLIQIIDKIGGVDFDVPIDMNYDDPTQDLAIHLKAGYQHIDGSKAEQLLRFRHNNDGTSYSAEYGDNDIGRMKTQREFIIETIKQTLQVSNVTKINDLVKIAFKNIETNLDLDYVLKYTPAAVDFNVSEIQTAYLPGAPAILGTQELWFYRTNRSETATVVEQLFTFNKNKSDAITVDE